MQIWDVPRYRQKRRFCDFLEFGRIGVARSFQKYLSTVTRTVTTGSSRNVPKSVLLRSFRFLRMRKHKDTPAACFALRAAL